MADEERQGETPTPPAALSAEEERRQRLKAGELVEVDRGDGTRRHLFDGALFQEGNKRYAGVARAGW